MTIRELYAWAQEHDALDLPFYMTFTVDNDYGGFDFYKHEVVPEIGTIENLDDGCITYYDTQEEFNSKRHAVANSKIVICEYST